MMQDPANTSRPGPRDDGQVTFRPLRQADMPLLQRWLADPTVAQWWREPDLSLTTVTAKYQPRIDGIEPVRAFIILIDTTAAGFIQAYRVDEHPGYARQLNVPAGAVATDLFLGEPSFRGRGWGQAVLRAFLHRIVFGEYRAPVAIIAPEPANTRAIHVYEQCGFRWLKTVAVVDDDNPLESGEEYVMMLAADAFTGVAGV